MRTAIALFALSVLSFADEGDVRGAALGIGTKQPTKEEGVDFKLEAIAGRWCGRLVTSVEEDGPASKAGLAVGDVLVRIGANDLYSQDDLDDVLRVAQRGAEATLVVKRAGTHEEESLTTTLDAATAAGDGLTWHFAGPGQIEEALALAKKEGKTVLVGLSGAET